MTLFNCFQPPRIKRKLHDYVINNNDHDDHHQHTWTPPKPSYNSSPPQQPRMMSSNHRIQFFVRLMSGPKSLVLFGYPNDTIEYIHHQILSKTGIPVSEQRLVYLGKHLNWEHTMFHYNITDNACLQLVARMRSTLFPECCQLIDDLLYLVTQMCNGEIIVCLISLLNKFISITPKESVRDASSFFHTFVSSPAPDALVMLYLSPHKDNKQCAFDSIKHFIKSSKIELEIPLYSKFAVIVLHFCKLLQKAVPLDDPLYMFCRASLGSMLEYVKIGHLNSMDDHKNSGHNIQVEDIFLFVDEIAKQLSNGLVSSMNSIIHPGPSGSDVIDFSKFVRSVINAIVEPVAYRNLRPATCNKNRAWYDHQRNHLYSVYFNLLAKLQACLSKMGDHIKERRAKGVVGFGWGQYFSILKALLNISKIYDGAEERFWANLRDNKASFCYLIVNYSKRDDEDYKWIFQHKDLTDFESRRHLVTMMLPEVTHDYDDLHEMLINRDQLLPISFTSITGADINSLRGPLLIGFTNEEATGPGVLREWFLLVCQAIFDPQNALFVACPTDRRRFFPNPASKVDPMHLKYFKFAGRVIALALMRKMQVGIVFSRAFFLQLAGVDVSLEDIKDADPYLYSSCKQIMDMDPCVVDQDVLSLTFIREVEELGSTKLVELLPDGKHISVNSTNRKLYIDLVIRHQFVTSVAQQVSQFAKGFADIVTEEVRKLYFKSLEPEDLDGILHGSENAISVDDWKAHTEYKGYKVTDPQICWFWKVVGEMSAEQRKILLFFWTSVKYLPVEGFGGLASKLYIHNSYETVDRLPSSHTCFYQICFPAYPSLDVMQQRLNIITQEHVGCSFGTW